VFVDLIFFFKLFSDYERKATLRRPFLTFKRD